MLDVLDTRSKLCLLAALALVSAACGTDGGTRDIVGGETVAPAPEVVFTIADQGVTDVPEQLQAGPNTITVANEGKDKHFPAIVRINDGVRRQRPALALAEGDFKTFFTSAIPAGTVTSGRLNLRPGARGQLTTELTEGEYMLADPEAKRFEPGFFTVGPAPSHEVLAPQEDYEVVVGEYHIKFPDNPSAGRQTVALMNAGEQAHELVLENKKTENEAGYAMAPVPGSTSWVTFDLEPGTYVVACFFPDVKGGKVGKPHVELGMKTTITVK